MEVLCSARRHDVEVPDIHHRVQNALVVEEIGDDLVRCQVPGPGRAGDLLELVEGLDEGAEQDY